MIGRRLFGSHTQTWLLLFVLTSLSGWARAQYEVPDEIFQRTLLIRTGNEQATAFTFDQNRRIYVVTTRHFGKHLPLNNAVVQIWIDQTWKKLQTVRTIFPASKEVDLAIFETDERLTKPYSVVKSEEVLTTGQKVWFMGEFGPLKQPSMPELLPKPLRPFPEVPFIRVGTISAINPTQPEAFEIHFGGSYNLLIAGGPIVYWSPVHGDYEILGVIKRNDRAAAKLPSDGRSPPGTVESGVIEGYSIDIVVETIRDHSHA